MHFQGLEVPALGSPRDIIFRKYLTHKARTEAAKHKLMLLQTIGTPMFSSEEASRKWSKKAGRIFDEYLSGLFGVPDIGLKEEEREEAEQEQLLEFYNKVVKPSKVKLSRNGEGKLTATGLPKV